MPLSKYNAAFGGKKGAAAKAHAAMVKEYGAKKGESVFYATKNARMKSHLPPGATLSPKGDLGARRATELSSAFPRTIKNSGKAPKNPLTFRRPETAIDGKFGPGDTVCGG